MTAFNRAKQQFSAAVKSICIPCMANKLASAFIAPQVRRDPPAKSLAEAKQRVEQAQKRQSRGKLSTLVYQPHSPSNPSFIPSKPPPGVFGPFVELDPRLFEDAKSGFKAKLYKTGNNSYVLAFAGTEDGTDWLNNIAQVAGVESAQYRQAIELAAKVKAWAASQGASLEFTGHSLGGGLASAAAMSTGLPATVFNAARVSQGTMDRYGLSPVGARIENNYVEGEILTGVQEHAASIGFVAGSLGGPAASGALGALANYSIGTPIGNQRSLAAIDPGSDAPAGSGSSPLARHGMDFVTKGLERDTLNAQSAVAAFGGTQ